ncbi:zeta toxin family protein [Streptomyces thermoalcalitolerans]|uniref:zeta toxin family protein n=1 Tax=Streptomyces thermoalcalitolerans TaxID=65605 RepID=UPI003CD07D59
MLVLLGGQPAVGKSQAMAAARQRHAERQLVPLTGDELRPFHPQHRRSWKAVAVPGRHRPGFRHPSRRHASTSATESAVYNSRRAAAVAGTPTAPRHAARSTYTARWSTAHLDQQPTHPDKTTQNPLTGPVTTARPATRRRAVR